MSDQNLIPVVYAPHPLREIGRQHHALVHIEGETYAALVERAGIRHEDALEVRVNGRPLTRVEQATHSVQEHDFVTITKAVEDRGVMRLVVGVVALVISYCFPIAAPYVLAAAGLLNATVFAPKIPKLDQKQESPTYSLSNARNQARIGQPMPVVYGTTKIVPDYGANPYVEYVGEDQWLFQVFNFGISDIAISDIKIGETPLENFTDVKYEISGPDGKLTLFPGNVDTTAVAVKLEQNVVNTRTTSLNTTQIGIDIEALMYRLKTNGKYKDETAVLQIQFRQVGTETWYDFTDTAAYEYDTYVRGVRQESDYVPPVIPPAVTAPRTEVDPRYSAYYDGSKMSRIETWYTGYAISGHDPEKPHRFTISRTVPKGQYEVMVVQLTDNIGNDETKSVDDVAEHHADITWSLLKSYQPDEGDYTGQTRMAIMIRASGQLNGVIDELNAIATASIPVYVDGEWVTQPSSNPAWCYLHNARGARDASNRKIFGGCIPDERIDFDRLADWAAFCDIANLSFNGVFDQPMTVADSLATIARVGRASLSWSTGKLATVFDKPDLPVTQLFTMANVRAGTFKVNYSSEKIADEIRIKFINPDIGWKQDVVSALMPGIEIPTLTTEYEVFGITSKDQAGREANLQAAAQKYHGKLISWETDMEGLVCSRGDVVLMSHDVTSWGTSGRLDVGSTATTLHLSTPVTFTAATTPYVVVRHPSGLIETRDVVTQADGTVTSAIVVASPLAASPSADAVNLPMDYTFSFDPATTPGNKLKLINLEPMSDNHVLLVAREEVDGYYEAEDGDYTYVAPVLSNVGLPAISNVAVAEQLLEPDRDTVRLTISWNIVNAESARLRVAGEGGAFIDYGIVNARTYSLLWYTPERITIELTPITAVRLKQQPGIATYVYDVRGQAAYPEDVPTSLPRVNGLELFDQANDSEFVGQDAKFQWRKVAAGAAEVGSELQGADSGGEDPYFKDYQVVIRDAATDEVRRTEYVKDNAYTYTYEKNFEDGIVRSFTIEVRARGIQNQISSQPARLTVSNPPPAALTGLELSHAVGTSFLKYTRPTETDFVGVMAWLSTTSGFTPAPENLAGENVDNTFIFTNLTPGTVYYIHAAGYDTFGQTDLSMSSELAFTAVKVNVSDLSADVIALMATGDEDIAAELEDLEDALATETTARAAAISAEAAARLSGDSGEATARAAAITTEATTRASADTALSSSLTTLGATVSGHTASIASEVSTRAAADSALASDITTLNTTVGGHSSSITTINGTLSTQAGSISSINTTLTSHSTSISGLTTTTATHTSQISTITSDVSSLSSSLTSLSSTVSGNTSAISSEASARASADSALSSSLSTLSTTVSGNTASISTQATSISGIQAKYAVKVDVNGYVSGYGLISTANNGVPTSIFAVLADNFAVYNGSTAVNPFTVSGGTVYLTNAVANNIAANSISATQIQSGAVTASKISVTDLSVIGGANTGSLNVTGSLAVGTSGNIHSGQTAYNTGTGFWIEYNAGTPRMSIGNSSGSHMTWDGALLTVIGKLKYTDIQYLYDTQITWSGFSTNPQGVLRWVDFGNFVVMWWDCYRPTDVSAPRTSGTISYGTSNSTSFSIQLPTGPPRPSASTRAFTNIIDATALYPASIEISNSGTLTFSKLNSGGTYVNYNLTGFTASSSKGIDFGAHWIYPYY